MSRTSVAAAAAAMMLALGVLGPASAHPHHGTKYGGTLVVGVTAGGDPSTLDPTLILGTSLSMESFCEGLYYVDARQRITPLLATALPTISKDKLTYTIPLRKGVRFNDGTPFNAQAVVTTLERDMNHPASTRASDLESLERVTASGPNTVVIRLKARFTPLTAALAGVSGMIMSPTQLGKLGDDFGRDPVCVGPFMFDDRVVGDRITVVKSRNYYNQGAVHLDKIVYKNTPDQTAAALALRAGDLQVVDQLDTADVPGVQASPNLWLLQTRGIVWRGVRINIGNKHGRGSLPYARDVGTPLSQSAKLRQAFEEAIDRNALVRVVYGGIALPGCTPIGPASPMFDAGIDCAPYDPVHARKLVAASGFANPTVHFLTNTLPPSQRLAQFIQAQEAAVGISVVIDSAPSATVQDRGETGDFDTSFVNTGGGPDPYLSMYRNVATSGNNNFGGYSNPKLDLILANTRKATSPKARKTLYRAAQQILLNDRPYIVLFYPMRSVGVSAGVTGLDESFRYAFAQLR